MHELSITVHDLPAPQGSKKHVGGGRMIESSKYVKPWREAVKHAALAAISAIAPAVDGPFVTIDGPVELDIVFTLPRPRSHYRTGRNAHLLRDGAPAWPHHKPDVDKLARSTFDALGAAGVFSDDARVVLLHASKVYPGGYGALEHAGALIEVHALTASLVTA